jgi:hypothetical protein
MTINLAHAFCSCLLSLGILVCLHTGSHTIDIQLIQFQFIESRHIIFDAVWLHLFASLLSFLTQWQADQHFFLLASLLNLSYMATSNTNVLTGFLSFKQSTRWYSHKCFFLWRSCYFSQLLNHDPLLVNWFWLTSWLPLLYIEQPIFVQPQTLCLTVAFLFSFLTRWHKQINVDFLKSLFEQIRYCSQTLVIGCTNAWEYNCPTTNTVLYLTD